MMKTRRTGTLSPKKDTGGTMRRGVLALVVLLLACVLMAGAVSAENSEWDTLYANLTDGKDYTLTGNIENANTSLTIGEGKTVTLNLAGYNLSNITGTKGYLITLNGGNLTITGNGGVIFSDNTSIVAVKKGKLTVSNGVTLNTSKKIGIAIFGNEGQADASEYSVVDVQSGATIDGGIVGITIGTTKDAKGVYGVNLTVNGVVKTTVTDDFLKTNGGTIGINVNGNVNNVASNTSVKLDGNVPKITIGKDAKISAVRGTTGNTNNDAGPAVYAAGYAEWIINGGSFDGDEALSIKSGDFTVSDGTFAGAGLFADPATSWGSGSESTGAAVSVITNHGYAKNVNITITGGTFTSTNQSAFYEGPGTSHRGTALKKVAISGSTFTTSNETLSAITIHNSGNTTITGGISIKDSSNNLLYRGVNLTDAAKWTGDNTKGYTLELKSTGTYKLMESVNLNSMTVSTESVTIDGNKDAGVKATLVASAGTNPIKISGNTVTLKNLDLTAAAGYLNADANGVVQFTGTGGKLQDSKIDFNGITISSGSFAAVRLNGENGEVSGSEIINGHSTASSSQCIVVGGDNAVIENNKLTTGKAKADLKADGTTSSGSVAIRVTGAVSKISVMNNSITSTWSGSETTRNSGVGLDTFTGTSITATITNNTFTLNDANRSVTDNKALGGYGSVLYINPKSVTSTITTTITGNIVKKGTYLIYADGNDGATSITVTGTVSNNNFGTITGKKAEHSTGVTTFTISGITWTDNVEPAVPEVPSVTPTKKPDGTQEVKPENVDDTSINTATNTAKIGDETAVVHVEISGDGVARDSTNGTITIPATAEIKAVYKESPAESPSSVGTTEYQINITLNEVNTTYLPTISPAYNETKASQIAGMGYAVAAMITATNDAATLVTINEKIKTGGVAVTFKVPKTWADTFGLDRIVGFHIIAGNPVGDPLPVVRGPDDGDFYTFIVKTDGFSTIVLAASTQPITPVPTYQPVYSSGDGNMENSFRVLFDTIGGSFISPVTYLSYGDKISQPPAPTKDGYTFGGWYKDSACTQSWSFSEGIPGDMTLYAKWTPSSGGQSSSSQQTVSQTGSATAQQTVKATPAATQAQSTSAASGTAASGSTSPSMTQAPAPVLGALLGLLAAGVLLRRRD